MHPAVDASHRALETMFGEGESTESCPWRSFYDPVVRDVLSAYPFFESGQLAEWWGDDPPQVLVDGVRAYHEALSIVRAHDDEERAKKREREAEARRARRGAA